MGLLEKMQLQQVFYFWNIQVLEQVHYQSFVTHHKKYLPNFLSATWLPYDQSWNNVEETVRKETILSGNASHINVYYQEHTSSKA